MRMELIYTAFLSAELLGFNPHRLGVRGGSSSGAVLEAKGIWDTDRRSSRRIVLRVDTMPLRCCHSID